MRGVVQKLKSRVPVTIDGNLSLLVINEKGITSDHVAWLSDDEVGHFTERRFHHTSASNLRSFIDKMAYFITTMDAKWDLVRFDADVRESQVRRHIVYAAMCQEHYYPWDCQPL